MLPALLAALFVLAVDINFERNAVASRNNELRLSTLNTLGTLRARLEGTLNSNAQLIRGMVANVALDPNITNERFSALAAQLFQAKSQLRNIGAAPDLVIRYMYPLEGNEAAIGLDYNTNADQRAAALHARNVRDIILAGPINLVQGGQGFISRVPVFTNDGKGGQDRFWGLISAVIDVEKLYQASGLQDENLSIEIAIRGKDAQGAAGDLFFGEQSVFDSDPVNVDVVLPYGTWRMAAIPKGGWPENTETVLVIRSVSVFFAILFIGFLVIAGRLSSQRKLAEQIALQSEAKFRDFAHASSDWFWEMDENLRITYISERFETITGRPVSAILGKTRRELLSQETLERDKAKWQRHFDDLAAHRPFKNFEYDILPEYSGGDVTIKISGIPVFDQSGTFKGYRGSGEDVTDRIRTQNELRIARDQANRANQAKSEFLSSMSHELRTPLNSILGFAQVLEIGTENPLSDKQKSAVRLIIKGGEHLLNLVNDVLNLAGIESGKLSLSIEPFYIQDIIDECISNIQPFAERQGVGIEAANCIDMALMVDPIRLKQVLLNLLSNAVKYNHKGGSVRIKGAPAEDGAMYRLMVFDTGRGIPASKQHQLFIPFSRLGRENSNIEGTGIGLTITKRLVEAMNGKMDFSSVEGEGTTFWIDLPVAATEPGSYLPSSVPIERHEASLSGYILYIEDNPANLSLMEAVLADVQGVVLKTAHTAELGLATALQNPPNLILMDINLPGMNGIEALAELRRHEQTRDVPVIAISAAAMPGEVQRGMEAGFLAYLTKPLNILELIDHIHDVLGRRPM